MKRQRTTENVTLTIERVRAEKIRKEAARVGLTLSEYAVTLMEGATPAWSAAEVQTTALVANRIVRAISVLTPYQADNDAASDAIELLRSAQKLIADKHATDDLTYAAAITARNADDHWGDG